MSLRYRIGSLFPFAVVVVLAYATTGCSHRPALMETFQAELDSLHAQYQFPGATAAYVLPDGTAKGFAVGLSDVERELPMTPDSRMLAASIGKTFVGAAILALAQDGLLGLDDPVSKWLGDRPWFNRLPNHDTMTLRHLLNHTSGLPNHVENEQFAQAFRKGWEDIEHPPSPEELIAFVLDQPSVNAAGEGWSYTDTGYLLLGLIIEKISGRRWYDEVADRFLIPLHLSGTTPSDRVDLPGLAAGYMAKDNRFGLPSRTTTSSGYMGWNPMIEGPGGGFISNSRDLAVWGKTLFEGRAMRGDYLEELLKSVPVSPESPETRYGIAVAIHSNGPLGLTYGHGGWIPGYTSSLRYYPDFGIAIAFQINTDIGIVDGSTMVAEDMEKRLAEVVAAAVGK